MKKIPFLHFAACLVLPASSLWAGNFRLNYQGSLTDAATSLPAQGSKSLVFRIKNALSNGNSTCESADSAVWTSPSYAVNLSNGIFRVTLGDNDAAWDAVKWDSIEPCLETQVNGSVLNPPEKLSASAYSFFAAKAALMTSSASGGNLIPAAGNVGLGTLTPDSKLHVRSASIPMERSALGRFTMGGNSLFFGHNNPEYLSTIGSYNMNGAPFISFYSYHSTTNNILKRASSVNLPSVLQVSPLGLLEYRTAPSGTIDTDIANFTTRLAITNAGNVGIGTTNPQTMLDVAGDLQTTRLILRAGAAPTDRSASIRLLSGGNSLFFGHANPEYIATLGGYNMNGYPFLAFYAYHSATANTLKRASGKNPPSVLQVSSGGVLEYKTAPAGAMDADIADFTTRLAVTNAGNVGIGTASPGQKLDILNGNVRVAPGFDFLKTSDERLKKNISPLTGSLDKILAIRGVRYDLKEDRDSEKPGRLIGFLAQDVERQLPELVKTDENGFKAVAYDNLAPVLTEALKEEHERTEKTISELRAEIEGLKKQIASQTR